MDETKSRTLEKLNEAVLNGMVDEDVMPLLSALNGIENMVTTSSCSGRVQLISMPGPGDKKRSEVLGKWHRKVSVDEVMEAFKSWDGSGELHFLVQPLLVHIRCRDLPSAVWLRNLSHGLGLKFSTIRSVKLDEDGNPVPWGAMVEVQGTERIEVPVDGIGRKELEVCMEGWVRKGNHLMDRTGKHIHDLLEAVEKS